MTNQPFIRSAIRESFGLPGGYCPDLLCDPMAGSMVLL
jgi:hypothetical protein